MFRALRQSTLKRPPGRRLFATEGHTGAPINGDVLKATLPRLVSGGLLALSGVIFGAVLNSLAEKQAKERVQESMSSLKTESGRMHEVQATVNKLLEAEQTRETQENERERQERTREKESDRLTNIFLNSVKESESERNRQEKEREQQEKSRELKDKKTKEDLLACTAMLEDQEKERERQERQREKQEELRTKMQEAANSRWTEEIESAEKMRADQERERERQEREREQRQYQANIQRDTIERFVSNTKADLVQMVMNVQDQEKARELMAKELANKEADRVAAEHGRVAAYEAHRHAAYMGDLHELKMKMARQDQMHVPHFHDGGAPLLATARGG